MDQPPHLDLLQYTLALEQAKTAKERYNSASFELSRADMVARMKQLISQHEPLASIEKEACDLREKTRKICNFILCGRLE